MDGQVEGAVALLYRYKAWVYLASASINFRFVSSSGLSLFVGLSVFFSRIGESTDLSNCLVDETDEVVFIDVPSFSDELFDDLVCEAVILPGT